ncbi:MAG: 6-phosphofructokinase [Bacteriovoracaceae bacterium]|jgi:6-phosphofructokinase 1|nr:6-phosphofructokinase [Bacteriovoracaceae bacterium]
MNEGKKTDYKVKTKLENNSKIETIGVLTSGGDSPGMNCAIRAVVRTALGADLRVLGIKRGYAGLLEGDLEEMTPASVGNIIQRGGTFLQTSRCPDFFKKDIRKEAFHILTRKGVDALVVIGGDGSFNGAYKLFDETGIPVVGIPGTIDNDIAGTKYSIGYDTAVNTAVEAVDKIRDTASSHARIFLVEVMGRKSPAIAMAVAVCTGAENVIFPWTKIDYKKIAEDIERGIKRGKNSSILITAEGEEPGMSYGVQKVLKENYGIDSHVCILGHIQRGGRPTHLDRFMASKMGYVAVRALLDGQHPIVTSYNEGRIELVPMKDCLSKKTEEDFSNIGLARALSI